MRIFTLVLSLLLLCACDEQETLVNPPPEVFVVVVKEEPYQPSRGFNARIRSSNDVNIEAQVTGEIIAIHFKEGDTIERGAPLFDINPAPFVAELSRSEADLARTNASQLNAQRNLERGEKLVEDGFISVAEYDELETRSLEALAASQSAMAAVEKAQINLDFTSIKASQNGRVGRSNPAVGDIVGPQSGTLTSLVGQGDVDAVFQLPEKTLVSIRQESQINIDDITVELTLPNGSTYSDTGVVTYFSNRVDSTTGTVETMASFPNTDDILRPGMYVQATLRLRTPLMGVMALQAAVQVDQQGTYVLAVDDNNLVSRLNIITGDRFGEKTLVDSGLEEGEKIIIRGVQRAQAGDIVDAILFEPSTIPNQSISSEIMTSAGSVNDQ